MQLNESKLEDIKSIFYNKHNKSLVIVRVFYNENNENSNNNNNNNNYTNIENGRAIGFLKVRTIEMLHIEQKRSDLNKLSKKILENEEIKSPGFIEFDEINACILAYNYFDPELPQNYNKSKYVFFLIIFYCFYCVFISEFFGIYLQFSDFFFSIFSKF